MAIGVRDGAIDSVIARIRSGWQKFRDLVPMLASRDLLLGVKDRFCMSMQVMLFGSETSEVRLKRKDVKMARWVCNVHRDNISAEED